MSLLEAARNSEFKRLVNGDLSVENAVIIWTNFEGRATKFNPNGGKRTSRQATWLKEEGMKAGVSDMLLLKRTSQYGFLCIENKTRKGRQEPEQKVFQYDVERHGGKYIIVRSLDEFMKAIDNYLNGEL